MGCSLGAASIVGLVTGRVVERQTSHLKTLNAVDIEAVRGPILDVKVGDLSTVDLLDYDEVVRLVGAAVGALTI